MNYIWGILIILSVFCGITTGRIAEVSDAVLCGASDAIKLVISMFGMMCFWTGIMKIADACEITNILSKIFSPILKKLFKEYEKNNTAIKAICLNVTANLLGLGNAATPMGIAAMKEMQKQNKNKKTANNSMSMFVVLNTASIQLIPTFMTILRQKHGASNPFDILPCIWITSLVALIAGIIAAKIFEKRGKNV